MGKSEIFAKLPGALLPWYQQNMRDLPWREDRQPYHIWVSEIMLQQTRVEAVKGYYSRFLKALPTIDALARVDDDLLHKLWEGLGYYSRVRNLKKAAKVIVDDFGGKFPGTYEEVLKLPGIGEYTAGAICSIAFGLPTPAVDGNVLRVAARLLDDDTPVDLPEFKKTVREALAAVYPENAGDFTQALMELGATVCGPNKKPDCESCPCKDFCSGYFRGNTEMLPVRLPKRERKEQDMTVFILRCDGQYALEKRPDSGLLAGLWQFPNCKGHLDAQAALSKVEGFSLKPREISRVVERKHIFTHIQWHMRGVYVDVAEKNDAFSWFAAEQIDGEVALPTAFRQFWEEIDR